MPTFYFLFNFQTIYTLLSPLRVTSTHKNAVHRYYMQARRAVSPLQNQKSQNSPPSPSPSYSLQSSVSNSALTPNLPSSSSEI